MLCRVDLVTDRGITTGVEESVMTGKNLSRLSDPLPGMERDLDYDYQTTSFIVVHYKEPIGWGRIYLKSVFITAVEA